MCTCDKCQNLMLAYIFWQSFELPAIGETILILNPFLNRLFFKIITSFSIFRQH